MFKALTARCIIGVTTALLLGVSCGPGDVATVEPREDAAGTTPNRSGSGAAIADASMPPDDVSSSGEASGGTDASGPTPLAPSADGLALLEALRTRFTVLAAPPEPGPSEDETGEPPDEGDKSERYDKNHIDEG